METLRNDRLVARLLGKLSERDKSGAMDDAVSVGQEAAVETGQSTQDLVLLQVRQTNIQSRVMSEVITIARVYFGCGILSSVDRLKTKQHTSVCHKECSLG